MVVYGLDPRTGRDSRRVNNMNPAKARKLDPKRKSNKKEKAVYVDGQRFKSMKAAAVWIGCSYSSLWLAFSEGRTILKGYSIEKEVA